MFHVKQSALPIFSIWCFTWNIAIFFPCISHQAQLFFHISIFLSELHRQLNNRGFPLVILSPIYHQSSYCRLLIWNFSLRQLPIFFRNISYFRLLYLPTNYIIIYPWNSPGKRYKFTALLSQKRPPHFSSSSVRQSTYIIHKTELTQYSEFHNH